MRQDNQNINSLDQHATNLIKGSLSEELRHDIHKWDATINQSIPEKAAKHLLSEQELSRLENKQDAMKRVMLLIGSSGMVVHGNKIENDRVVQTNIEAANNNLPISAYYSGHGGRIYMSLPNGRSECVLNWISSGNKNSSTNIHKAKHFSANNRETELQTSEIMFDRHAGTHAASVNEGGEPQESKGLRYGLSGIMGRVFAKVTFGLFSKYHSPHLGINIPFGGDGNKYKGIDELITSDGKSGHAYFNVNSSSRGDTIGFGLEGTAPRTHGAIGAHSTTGGADRFTPGEGQKFFIKLDLKDPNFKIYMGDLARHYKDSQDPKEQEKYHKVKTYIDAYEHDSNRNPIFKLFNVGSELIRINKDELVHSVGLNVIKEANGSKMVATTLGSKLMESGVVIPYNYNGQKINLASEQNFRKLEEVMNIPANDIPKEIAYFKPQNNLSEFLAQKPIFANIETKPLLRDNPQLSLDVCHALSTAYDLQKSEQLSPEIKTALRQTLKIFENKEIAKEFKDYVKGIGFDNFSLNNPITTDTLNLLGNFINHNKDKLPQILEEANVSQKDLLDAKNVLLSSSLKQNDIIMGRQTYQSAITQEIKEYAITHIQTRADDYVDGRIAAKAETPTAKADMIKHSFEFLSFLDRKETKQVMSEAKIQEYKQKIEQFQKNDLAAENIDIKDNLKKYSSLVQGIKQFVSSKPVDNPLDKFHLLDNKAFIDNAKILRKNSENANEIANVSNKDANRKRNNSMPLFEEEQQQAKKKAK